MIHFQRCSIYLGILCIQLCISLISSEKNFALAICAVFQNEELFLKEWIEFHRLLGADHFHLYNNESSDNSLSILAPYIRSGLVEVIDWPVETRNQHEYLTLLQLPAYNHALNDLRETARWVAFIDIDEFICPVRHDSITEMLEDYADYPGLVVNWQAFGTSDIESLQEDDLIIEQLIWKAPSWWEINKYIKILVQPSYVHSFAENPHYCLFHEGHFAVNSDKVLIGDLSETQPIVINTVRIHHYWFGDRNWFIHQKLPRRKKWGVSINPDYIDAFIDSFNQERDETMLKFVPRLKAHFKK